MDLSDAELARYARQLILPGFDSSTQETIRSARVHVVGAGPVAGPALLYLAEAGIGTLYVDDGSDVEPGDAVSWLYAPADAGNQRLFAAIQAIQRASGFVKVRPHATGVAIDAALVCAPTANVARVAADRARLSGAPFVVALADGDDGTVVTVPRGEPCFSCASRPGSSLSPAPGVESATGSMAAMELLLVLAGQVRGPGSGRRIEMTQGQPAVFATQRRAGCDCSNAY